MSILGIAQSNHGSAAAVYDGESLHGCLEERFDRKKWSSGFPIQSVKWCIEQAGGFNNIEAIGFYLSNAHYLLAERNPDVVPYQDFLHVIPSSVLKNMKPAPDVKHIRQSFALFNGKSRKVDFYFIDHHMCHAAGAFLLSPFETAAILVMDGTGDGYSTSLWKGENNKVTPILRQPFPHSLGQFYTTFTQYLGYKKGDEFKMMGLAAYGDAAKYYEQVRSLVSPNLDAGFELDMRYFAFQMVTAQKKHNTKLEALLGIPPNGAYTEDPPQEYRDLAASVQFVTREIIERIVHELYDQADVSNLVYTGGVALNCAANGLIFSKGPFSQVYIPPHPGDGGLAIGAAAYIHNNLQNARRDFVYENDYIGPEYSNDEIKEVLDQAGAKYIELPKDPGKHIAESLSNDKIVGVFNGPAEFGPRALGHRSILASPRDPRMKEHLNAKVKMRESFRPFAPVCTRESLDIIFDPDGGPYDRHFARETRRWSPYNFMLEAIPVRSDWRGAIPAVTHEDGTARVQIVHEENFLYPILEAFRRDSGVPVLLNTSFNVRGEPIVLSPHDALRCFLSTGIDCLAIGPYWVEK